MVLKSTERLVETNGVRLRVVEAGERGAPVVILAHGFPELAYSWRHQIPVLAEAGYHVLAPDQRGYGGSSCPEAIEAYDIHHLTADLVGLLDDVGAERAVWVGHDWGAAVVWNAPLLHPDRVAAVAGLSVPAVPRSHVAPTRAWRKMLGDKFFYILYFQEPGVADAELNGDPARTLRRMLGGLRTSGDPLAAARMVAPGDEGFIDRLPEPDRLPDWLSQDELDHYISEFSRTGFTGGLNWYRNFDRNWETTPELADAKITVPALFIGGTADPVLTFTRADRASQLITGSYQQVMLEDAGHWLQQERPEEVNAALLDFLNGLELR
ncbi:MULTISPECIES: alpha/beta fold hydrolase [unclassified Mycobacterium]|uniref:alpha/beta fold hydrolase n=1 Tax=unclassified Mycobacterium TaxID=2642494 RepID=UPI0007FD7042|nr:epoxide hydrolase [Mycobacterium sp. E188]OBG55910.1 epoxide hydrolase [Mycobacterium sp. E735]OBG71730.1 epoxide hydrolase [Mycobacterium sp. E3305]OBG86057.1 epoxide hydrolase [Mycobacterium sp. E3298]OBH09638.1 epoxide hydrolase [Mycobacterium sp. E1715]OBH37413.1 epoxide hydrolase [Mycobacterium sp. E183]